MALKDWKNKPRGKGRKWAQNNKNRPGYNEDLEQMWSVCEKMDGVSFLEEMHKLVKGWLRANGIEPSTELPKEVE